MIGRRLNRSAPRESLLTPRWQYHVLIVVGMAFLSGCGRPQGNPESAGAASPDAIERTAEKGPVKLSVTVRPREPRLSDLVEMDVRVEYQPGVEVKPPAFGQAVGDFLIRDYTERPAGKGAENVRWFHYQLEPAHAGKHLIHAVSIEFLDRRAASGKPDEPVLVETDPLEVNVHSELGGQTPSLARLAPMAPPEPVRQGWSTGWLAALGLTVVLATCAIILLRRRSRKMIAPYRPSPEEIAGAALAQLLAEDLPGQGLIKEFYLRLTGIVRQYVEDTTGIRAPEQTTEEFLRDMRQRAVFPADRSERLAEFLEAADLVKYAGQQPGADQIDQSIARAREFVSMKPAQQAAMAGTAAT